MAVAEWPCLLMGSESDDWMLAGASEGSRTVAGFPTFVRVDGGGLWTLTLSNISLRRPDHIRAYGAITAAMDEGVNPVTVPYCIRATQPFLGSAPGSVPHSDGTPFGDGSLYAGRSIVCSIEDDAPLRATTVNIRRTHAAPFMGDEHFEINHSVWGKRMYRVIRVGADVSGVTTCEIRPPLRQAVTAGEPLNFDKPRCTMTISDPKGAGGPLLQRRRGQRTISFIEFGLPPA